jgi:hypothetical protein
VRKLRPYERSRCTEHVGVYVVQMSHRVLRPTHRDRHGLTTRALKLLMSIRIPLENTKRPEPHTMVGVEAPTPLPERSRFAKHIGKVEELCYGVLCPPHRR